MTTAILVLLVALQSVEAQADASKAGARRAEVAAAAASLELVLGNSWTALELKRRLLQAHVSTWLEAPTHEEAAELARVVGRARPVEHQYELCLDLAGLVAGDVMPTSPYRAEALDSWGAPTSAVIVERETTVSTAHFSGSAPDCLPGVQIRFIPDGQTVLAPFVDGVATARRRGPAPITAFSGLMQVSLVAPGWGDGAGADFSSGVRVQTWRRHFHLEFALKLSTFTTDWTASAPAGLSFDAFVGYPFELVTGPWDLRLAIDLGLWATLCPTLRLSGAAKLGHWFASLELGMHVYPMVFLPQYDRPADQRNTPLGSYLFWSLGAGLGYAL